MIGSWGSPTLIANSLAVSLSVTGVYELCIRGTDIYENVGDPACSYIVAYDPSGGFVTGGGWIDSPAAACHYDPVCAEAAGKANFGFVSRYKKGATVPTGNTEFQFEAGGLNFHSETYDWPVVNMNGINAQYKGSGTISHNLSPAGEAYKFMLWAQDLGNTGSDTFRIRIWYEDAGNEVEVYDNGFNQEIGGGNILVHTK